MGRAAPTESPEFAPERGVSWVDGGPSFDGSVREGADLVPGLVGVLGERVNGEGCWGLPPGAGA